MLKRILSALVATTALVASATSTTNAATTVANNGETVSTADVSVIETEATEVTTSVSEVTVTDTPTTAETTDVTTSTGTSTTTADISETTTTVTTTVKAETEDDGWPAIGDRIVLSVNVDGTDYDAKGLRNFGFVVPAGTEMVVFGVYKLKPESRIYYVHIPDRDAYGSVQGVDLSRLTDPKSQIEVLEHDALYLGDICVDGRLNVFDLCLFRKIIAGGGWCDDTEQYVRCDLNLDRKVNIADLVLLQQFLLGRIKKFY